MSQCHAQTLQQVAMNSHVSPISLCTSFQRRVLVQEAICSAGELFLAAHKGFHRQALLPARARDEGMSAGELLFDKLPGADSAETEADAWQVSYQRCLLMRVTL